MVDWYGRIMSFADFVPVGTGSFKDAAYDVIRSKVIFDVEEATYTVNVGIPKALFHAYYRYLGLDCLFFWLRLAMQALWLFILNKHDWIKLGHVEINTADF